VFVVFFAVLVVRVVLKENGKGKTA